MTNNLTKAFGAAVVALVAFAMTFAFAGASFTYNGGIMKAGSGYSSQTLALQQCLVELGVNTPSNVDGYYGSITKAAVMNFQRDHNLKTGENIAVDGIIGPVTGPLYTAACMNPSDPIVDGDDDDDDDDSSNTSLSNTEASFEKFKVSSEDDAEEGKKALVATIEFDVEDGDAMIERVDTTFTFVGAGTADTRPWKVFDELVLEVDGDEIASMDIDSKSDWRKDNTPFEVRLSGIEYLVKEGDTAEIEVYLTANGSVEDNANADWKISFETNAIRGVDGAGITQYVGDGSFVTFSIDDEGGDEDLNIKTSSNDPDSTLLLVDATEKSKWHEVFIFELEAEENDIDVDEIVISMETTTKFYNTIVDDLSVEVDGDDYDVDSVLYYTDNTYTVLSALAGSTPTAFALLTIDVDEDTTIDADDTVDVVVLASFNKADTVNYTSGETVKFGVRSVTGLGVDDVSATSSITGDVHTLSLSAASVEKVSWVTTVSPNNATGSLDLFFTVDNSDGDEDFDVLGAEILDSIGGTAFAAGATAETSLSTFGNFTRVSGDSVVTLPGLGFTVPEGRTVKFRVRYNATAVGTYEATVTSIAGVELADDDQLSPSMVI